VCLYSIFHQYELISFSEVIRKAEDLWLAILENRLSLTAHTVNNMLQVYADSGHTTAVKDFFEKYEEFGFKPDSYTYTIIIKMWSRLLDPEKAQQTFMEMRAAGIEPNYSVYL
jgi:pentatricopeptide repeat protein